MNLRIGQKNPGNIICFSFLFIACTNASSDEDRSASYECFEKVSHEKPSVLFSWNSIALTLSEGGIYNNSFFRSQESADYEKPLGSQSKGGKYNIEFTKDKVILRYMQYVQISRTQLPSGEYTKNLDSMIPTIRKTGFAMLYSATFPGKNTYTFDKKQKKLVFQNEKLFPTMKKGDWGAKKYKHTIKPGEGYTTSEFMGYLSEEEIKEIFPFYKDPPYTKIYPRCDRVGTVKNIFYDFLMSLSQILRW